MQPTSMSPVFVPRNKAGRKQRLGALVFNPSTNMIGTLVAYCPHCNEKVIASREEMIELGYRLRKNGKSLKTRLLQHILRSIETQLK